MRTPTMFPGEPDEEPSPQAETPPPACNLCDAPMGHLGDLCHVGIWPAERIFICRRCINVISELS